ncbi:MAG: RluA family pseudouridine synthase [Treponema sp.]|jgi:23S rRNA pseudouridine955/2504/2580 synthase|nr:RluA family pseudouridine synthase [Treponema sp.]
MRNLEILFENKDCLVINKPAGLATQGGERVASSLDTILAELRAPRPLLVHRLDKDTSGLILVAKTRASAAHFSALLAGKRSVSKQYLAVCAGSPRPGSGSITLELEVRGVVKQAETRYKQLAGNQDFSLLELELGTGRMHQIRRHLAQTGNPILGDDKYGDFALNKTLRKTGLKWLLLHASRLIVNDGDLALDISAPLPDYFAPFLQGLTCTPAENYGEVAETVNYAEKTIARGLCRYYAGLQ